MQKALQLPQLILEGLASDFEITSSSDVSFIVGTDKYQTY